MDTHPQDEPPRDKTMDKRMKTESKEDSSFALDSISVQTLLEMTEKSPNSKDQISESSDKAIPQLCQKLSALFSSSEQLVSMFSSKDVALEASGALPPKPAGIDFKAVRALYQNIKSMDVAVVTHAIMTASAELLKRFKQSEEKDVTHSTLSSPAAIRVQSLLIIFANPLLLEPEHQHLLLSLARILIVLGPAERSLAVSILASLSKDDLQEMVDTVQQCITVQLYELYEAGRVSESVQAATKLLKILYDANVKSRALPISAFYNDAVNNKELVDPDRQYYQWKRPHKYAFSFCNFPFILDLNTKCHILQMDSQKEMQEQFQMAFFHGLFNQSGFIEPFNVMRVRRDHLIHDAITHVQRQKENLKKQLRVQFIGEDAVDEGGVRKEFFQLVTQELFDPKYGMFSYREDSRLFWFSLQPEELQQVQQEMELQHQQTLTSQEALRRQHARLHQEGQAENDKRVAVRSEAESGRGSGDEAVELLEGVPVVRSGDEVEGVAEGEVMNWSVEPRDSGGEEGGQGASLVGTAATHDTAGNRPTDTPLSGSRAGGGTLLARHLAESDWELSREYELVGMLMGLAIYNSCILDVRFPTVVYKKLLRRSLGLEDLEKVDEGLAKGYRDLLSFSGDVEEVYDSSFQVTVEDIYGCKQTVDLAPGGGDRPLTNKNRRQYVNLCVKFYLETATERQFLAFARGFEHLIPQHMLKLFEPEELELLVCGISELDFEDLEKGTQYTDGYTENHKTIRQFWNVVHAMSEKEKKNLLMFVTGCDRAPFRGLGSLKFTISRNGPDSDRLPSVHTCFNHMLLPEYSSEAKLKERLLTAINNSQGFGLR